MIPGSKIHNIFKLWDSKEPLRAAQESGCKWLGDEA